MKLHHFKAISIFLSIYFSITVILTNKTLFYFPGTGRTFVFVILVYNTALIVFDRLDTKHHEFVQLVEIEKLNQSMKIAFGEKMQNIADEMLRLKHDMTSLCTVVLGYIDKGMNDYARERLKTQITNLDKINLMTHTGQIAIDSIIDYMLCQMKEYNILLEENVRRIQIPITLSNDLATVLSIALNNAIEASLQVEDENKTIHLSILRHNNHLIIHIMNPIQKGHKPIFHKTSKLVDSYQHGFGISNMKNIVKRYNGELEFNVTEDTVDLKIIVEIK